MVNFTLTFGYRDPQEGTRTKMKMETPLLIFDATNLDIETPERGRERALYALSTYRISLDIGNPEKGSEH